MPPQAEIDVRVAGLRKRYGDVTAVDGVDLEIRRGEFFTMLGPSGSGKTTTLRVIAGFEQPDEGSVELGGRDVSKLPPYARDVNTVFQDYALFPHMTVQDNVEYGLRVKKVPRAERRRRAAEALALVRLESYGGRKPGQLSGGQRQRVALARAIVNRPQALLLDEPLGALDLKLRQELQIELKRIQQELGITFVYVTHDQEEALTMSDRLAVFNEGRIEQIGAPAEVYEHPASEFIAGFVGVSNVLERGGRRFTVRPEKIRLLGDGREPGAGRRRGGGADRERRLRRGDHALPRRARRRRRADRGEPEPRARLERGVGATGNADPGELAARERIHDRDQVERRRRGMSKQKVGRWAAALLATGVLSVMAAGCGGDDNEAGGAGTTAAETTGGTPEGMMQTLGEGEGQVNLIAWAGYVEDGTTDPKVDWVTDFEKETGCQVNVKTGNTSDEMVTLMRTGQYDGVSASGDASLRLIAAGDVAPVNLDLIPNYENVFEGLKNQPHNTVDGVSYGVPHGRGANLLQYRTDVVKPAPDSWAVVWDKGDPYKGKVTAYDSPIYIADAAVYLKATQPDLGIEDPYELDQKQFDAAVELLKQQRQNIGEYWSDYTKQIAAFTGGESVVGTTWQVITNVLEGEKVPVAAVLPKEGLDRLVGHVDDLVQGQEPELHVHVDEPHHLAEGERGRDRVLRRGPVLQGSVLDDRQQGSLHDLPRRRRGVLRPDLLLEDAAGRLRRRPWPGLQGLLGMDASLD